MFTKKYTNTIGERLNVKYGFKILSLSNANISNNKINLDINPEKNQSTGKIIEKTKEELRLDQKEREAQTKKNIADLKKQTIEEGPTYSNPDLKNDWNYRGGEYYQFPDPEKITRSPRVFRDSQTRDTARQANYAGEHHRKKAAQSKHDQVIGLAKKLGSLKTQRGGGIVGKNKIIKGYKKGGKI